MSSQPPPAPYDPRHTPGPYPPPYGQPHAPGPSGARVGDVPKAFWIGAVVAVLGFFVHAYYSHVSSGPDGYSCSYTDFGAFAVAAVVVACVGAGWVARANRRLATPLMLAISLLLLVLAAVHVTRGLGIVGNPCDAHPLP